MWLGFNDFFVDIGEPETKFKKFNDPEKNLKAHKTLEYEEGIAVWDYDEDVCSVFEWKRGSQWLFGDS